VGIVAAVELKDGSLLMAGGWSSNNPTDALKSADLVDPVTGTVTTLDLPAPRAQSAGVLLPDGRALIVGGVSSSSSPCLKTAELYVPGDETTTGQNSP
jgi:hypothetical protein